MLKIAPAAGADPCWAAVPFRPPGPLEIRFLVGADLPCAHGRVLLAFRCCRWCGMNSARAESGKMKLGQEYTTEAYDKSNKQPRISV